MKAKIKYGALLVFILALPLSIASHNGLEDTDNDGILNMNDRCGDTKSKILYTWQEQSFQVPIEQYFSYAGVINCQNNCGFQTNYCSCLKVVGYEAEPVLKMVRVRQTIMPTVDATGCADGERVTMSDYDSDGIVGTYDKCTRMAEDFDGFQDSDGCPEANV